MYLYEGTVHNVCRFVIRNSPVLVFPNIFSEKLVFCLRSNGILLGQV